jgi:hypothetical protein
MLSWWSDAAFGLDHKMLPAQDGEELKVELTLASNLEAGPIRANYRSEICKRIRSGASGQQIELDGYNNMQVEFSRGEGGGSVYAKIPFDGGGDCQWRLSNIFVGIAIKDTSEFGGDTAPSGQRRLVISLDDRIPQILSSYYRVLSGDVKIKEDYYPWVDEEFMGPYEKSVRLAGDGPLNKNYWAQQARHVYVEAVLHSDFPVYSQGPAVMAKGNRTIFTYPDGTSGPEILSEPNFRKLQHIRLGSSTSHGVTH